MINIMLYNNNGVQVIVDENLDNSNCIIRTDTWSIFYLDDDTIHIFNKNNELVLQFDMKSDSDLIKYLDIKNLVTLDNDKIVYAFDKLINNRIEKIFHLKAFI